MTLRQQCRIYQNLLVNFLRPFARPAPQTAKEIHYIRLQEKEKKKIKTQTPGQICNSEEKSINENEKEKEKRKKRTDTKPDIHCTTKKEVYSVCCWSLVAPPTASFRHSPVLAVSRLLFRVDVPHHVIGQSDDAESRSLCHL